jgi:hypothetical protein
MGTRQAWLRNWFWWLAMAAVAVYLAETLGALAVTLLATGMSRRRAAARDGRWVVKIYDPAGTCVAVHESRRAASEAQALAAALEADRDG